MKIGILTFHRPINYGAYMQAYSLSNKIASYSDDFNVEIIDYIAPKERNKIYLNILRTVKHYGVSAGIKEISKIRLFKKSLAYLPLSKNKFCKEPLNELYEYINNNYDLLIIGSDAVFNWNQNGYPTAFIPDFDFKIPVITYAASVHGLKYYEIEKEKIVECGKAFSRMSLVGVRDANTEKFVNVCNSNVTPIHCCDPTVVLDINSLNSIPSRKNSKIESKYKIDLDKPYIILMIEDQKIGNYIYDKYSNKYQVFSLFKKNTKTDAFLYDLSPKEWVMIISKAKFVVTNYFHGTLLALKQTVPTIVVDMSNYEKPYEAKLQDLMCTRLDLSELYIKQKEWDGNLDKINEIIEKCENGEYNVRISDAMEREGRCFDSFMKQIISLI